MPVRVLKPVVKPKVKAGQKASRHDPNRIQTVEDAEAWMVEIENDAKATPWQKELVALMRERDKSKEPYLTIEQIMAELGRG
jgi:hypothetical protein